MIKVLVDSSFYIASAIITDANNKKVKPAVEKLEQEGCKEITTDDFLKETLTTLSQRLGKIKAIEFYEKLTEKTEIIVINDTQFYKGLDTFSDKTLNKNISLIDCIASVVYKDIGAHAILTFDRHFRSLGFKTIP